MASASSSTATMSGDTNSLAASLEGTDLSNLYSVIDRHNVHGLNLVVPEDAKVVIKPWVDREDNEKYAVSNVDDQLIIHIPFMERVRIRSILLKLGRGESTPRHLRIYANHSNIIDFEDAEGTNPQLNITLLEGQTGVVEYPLRSAAFASIHSLTLFFNEAVGDEQSLIYYIGFRGDLRSTKQSQTSELEVPAPHTSDASLVDKAANRAAQQPTAR